MGCYRDKLNEKAIRELSERVDELSLRVNKGSEKLNSLQSAVHQLEFQLLKNEHGIPCSLNKGRDDESEKTSI